jgi:hypothetical protein
VSEPTWHLAFVPMPPRPGEPDPSVRVRRLLKFAKRALRLRCVSLKEPPPDPLAWAGWAFVWGGWARVCCHATEDGCRKVLAQCGHGDTGRVLPKGQVPG